MSILFPPSTLKCILAAFRFLVMERMAAPLHEVITILLDSHNNNSKAKGKGGVTKIPMGDIAVAMLNCIECMHNNGNLFNDVKPENFMLAEPSSTRGATSKSKKSSSDVSQRVRLIDFGLIERYGDMSTSKIRENVFPDAPLVGTPTYASLFVHSGNTTSRRDDLEALGYVIAELILMLVGSGGENSSNTKKGKKKKEDDDKSILPWGHATSDEELFEIKSQEMDKSKRKKSKLFAGLKDGGADTVMANYFDTVGNLSYSEKPDYDALRCYLKKLVVTVESSIGGGAKKKASASSTSTPKKKAAAAAKSPVTRRTSARRKHQEEDDDNDDEDNDDCMEVENVENCKLPPGSKKQKVTVGKESVPPRRTRSARNEPKTREIGIQTDQEVINLADSSDDDDDAMDWEVSEKRAADSDEEEEEIEGKAILKLDIVEGPYKSQEIPLGGDFPDAICVGSNPDSRAMKDTTKFSLKNDSSVSTVHAKFVINSNSSVLSVRVTDMSSSSILVNGSSLSKGKSKQAFVGCKIKVGETMFQVKKA